MHESSSSPYARTILHIQNDSWVSKRCMFDLFLGIFEFGLRKSDGLLLMVVNDIVGQIDEQLAQTAFSGCIVSKD